ncbi:ribosome recycling factor [Candidatus Dependentiae bacterium HGW-Dependentiae-1]|nr:MAG: ribosome recycling factor [Candidatus Dependentiae bacterium HGW-Dependentiae-1]
MSLKDFVLIENDVKGFEKAMTQEMEKPIKHFEGELIKIRTGRAHTSLIEDIQVATYYSPTPMALKNIAAIAAPDARLLTIQPWDIAIINDIEKAITNSELGVTPVNDGKIIRIQLPQMSSSRRDELAKILGKKLEECKVNLRNVRRDFHEIVRNGKKDKKISEDFHNRLSDSLQKVTDAVIEKADQLAKKKEIEITSV